MRVLVLSQFYPPEVGATQTRVHHFARHLSTAGHDVAVIAELPNHPRGVIFDGFRGRMYDRRREDGLDVVRVWVHASQRKSFWRRITFYLSYAVNATWAALLIVRRRPDIIFASSPPLPVLLVAWILSAIWRRPYLADIRDIWPAIGVALGELRGGPIIRVALALERALYHGAVAVTAVTQGFVRHVIAQGAEATKVYHLPNGTLPDVFSPDRVEPDRRLLLNLNDSFVVGYVGNHGIAQGLHTAVNAAQLLHDTQTQFLFVGDGPVKRELIESCDRLGLTNVMFHPPVPIEDASTFINACDVMLVPLRNLALLDTFIPSKMFDYMACGKPVILMVGGEAKELLEASGGGFSVEPENSEALAGTIRQLMVDPARLTVAGKSGREWVLAHHSREVQADKLARILDDVVVTRA